MSYKEVRIEPEDLLKTNFLFPLYSEQLAELDGGAEILRRVQTATRHGYHASPGSLWSKVGLVENLGDGEEVDLVLGKPGKQLKTKKLIKGHWILHVYPTSFAGQKTPTSYSLMLCESVERLPYDLMVFDPKIHGLDYLGDTGRYDLGPDSRLTLFTSSKKSDAVQVAATIPDWEQEIKRVLSSITAVHQTYLADGWFITNMWSDGVMLVCPRILSFHSE